MKALTYLANKYGTDKGNEIAYAHGFTEIYDEYFQKIAEKCYSEHRKVNILEIGVLDAKSLYAYNDFFNGNCEIYGIDINDSCVELSTENIHIYICNQSDRNEIKNFLNNVNIKYDIIIDDGSHISEHQIISLSSFHKYVANNGIYILEDLHTSLSTEFGNVETEDSALYYLTFGKPSIFLTDEENNELKDNIKTVSIFCTNNEANYNFDNKSITSIITFKNN